MMRIWSFKRWRARELLLSWIVYWIVFAVVGLGPAALAMWRATRGPASDNANINLRLGNTLFELVVQLNGRTTYDGSIHLLTLVLLVAGPPILAAIAWAATRRRAEEVREVV